MWAATLHALLSTPQTESKLTGANFSYELDPFFSITERCGSAVKGRIDILPQAGQFYYTTADCGVNTAFGCFHYCWMGRTVRII